MAGGSRKRRHRELLEAFRVRARLAVMAAPRDSDSPRLAKLRAVLRDQALMAHVTANVEQWPPLSEEQRDTLAALLDRTAQRPARRRAA